MVQSKTERVEIASAHQVMHHGTLIQLGGRLGPFNVQGCYSLCVTILPRGGFEEEGWENG